MSRLPPLRLLQAALPLALLAAAVSLAAPLGAAVPGEPAQVAPAAGAAAPEEGWIELFNGTDLSGWVPVNVGAGTFVARDGMIVCDGVPTGVLRTERMYENFVLELEWRHLQAGGNAGLFVWSDGLPAPGVPFTRSVEVQILDGVETENYTSDGDVFAIWGATMTPDRPHPAGWARCLPSEKRARPAPEWNHYRVTCVDGRLELEVNGKVVSGGSAITPRKGYLCLESEGSEVHFRNLRLRELPPADPPIPAEEVATAAEGWRSLYNGRDLSGWRVEPAHEGHWTASDWRLVHDGQGDSLWTEESFGDFELLVDWRLPAEPRPERVPVVERDGRDALGVDGEPLMVEVPVAGDSGLYLRGSSKSQVNIWCWPIGSGEVHGYRTDPEQPPEVRAAVTPRVKADAPLGEWNRFHVTMRGERLTVVLNGQTVLEDALLPGVAPEGPLALQQHGSPIEFANLSVRPLPREMPRVALVLGPAGGVVDDAGQQEARAARSVARLRRLREAPPVAMGHRSERRDVLLQRAVEQPDARLVFLGDSITQGWEGAGQRIWNERFAPRGALQLGIGGERTDHVLERLVLGDLDGLQPEVVVLLIGTNDSAAGATPEQIAAGVEEILDELALHLPGARVLLLGLLPRGATADDPLRRNNEAANVLLARLADGQRVVYRDIGAVFLEPDGTLSERIMPDRLHLSEEGYARWAGALEGPLQQLGLQP